jgi:gas vesicle protein
VEYLLNAISALLGIVIGGIITYKSSIALFRKQQSYELRIKSKEIIFQKSNLLYKKLEEYKNQLNKCFWEAQDTNVFTAEYYIDQGKKLRKLVDEINYLALFTNVPEKIYKDYQKDIFSFWRTYTKHIGDEKFEELKELKELKVKKISKEELASNWAQENSIIDQMQKETASKIRNYLKDIETST